MWLLFSKSQGEKTAPGNSERRKGKTQQLSSKYTINIPSIFLSGEQLLPLFFSVTVKNSDVSSAHILTAVLFFCATYIN